MARETAAQRRDREAAEQAERLAALVAQYPQRFLQALSDALREGVELSAVDPLNGLYTFTFPNDPYLSRMDVRAVPRIIGWDDIWALERLEDKVNDMRVERQEAERRVEMRKNALAKLTPEERELLGV